MTTPISFGCKPYWPTTPKMTVFWALLLLFGVLGNLPAVAAEQVAQEAAIEISEETAAEARRLQLEGTRLQLRGDRQGAVGKYRQSIELNPNLALENLVVQLERHLARTSQEKQEIVEDEQVSAETTAIVQEKPVESEEPIATPDKAVEPEKTVAVKSVRPKRNPASPEEALVYAFTDWFINSFQPEEQGVLLSLETNWDYPLLPEDGSYTVRLSPFIVTIEGGSRVDFSPLTLEFELQGDDRVGVTFRVPTTIAFLEDDSVVAELMIGSQNIASTWDSKRQKFERFEMIGDDLLIRGTGKSDHVNLKHVSISQVFSENATGAWEEFYQWTLAGISLQVANLKQMSISQVLSETEPWKFYQTSFASILLQKITDTPDARLEIDNISGRYKFGGSNLERLTEVKKLFYNKDVAISFNDILDMTPSLDFSLILDKLTLIGGDKIFTLGSGELSNTAQEEPINKSYELVAKNGFDDLELTFGSLLHEKPTRYAADRIETTLKVTVNMASRDDTYSESIFAMNDVAYHKKVLGLMDSGSGEVNLQGVHIDNENTGAVNLTMLGFGGGFDVDSGEGRSAKAFISLSGFTTGEETPFTIPNAANIRVELDNVPSLLNLIPDSIEMTETDMDMLQLQLLMNGMETLMASALTVSLVDSYISFPNSRINLNIAAIVNPEAQYFATGEFDLAMENSSDLIKIAKEFGAYVDTEKLLTTLIALGDRSQENGVTVDRLKATFDQEGKVYMNDKDVTILLFPDQQ